MLSALLLAGLFLWGASQALAFKPLCFSTWEGNLTSHSMKESGMDFKNFAKKVVSSTVNLKLHRKPSVSSSLCKLASRGSDPIIAVGFGQAAHLLKCKRVPKNQIQIIDMVVDLPNVQSIILKNTKVRSL
ncbi:MAG: hypothetical protein CM1200mP30_04460 [Pseudomonadota bacterium]|nr:MAG: hypothetical protein CM1200mP30_04460 [Pseudomonadota bacterium]